MKTFYEEFIDKNIKYKNYDFKDAKFDIKIARDNLLLFKQICDKYEVKFFLLFGTLLGAVRENNFIKYDTDVDVGILETERKKLQNATPELLENGFKIVRNYKSPMQDIDDLVTFMKNGVYIDIGIFDIRGGYYMYQNNKVPIKFLDKLEKIEFLGNSFFVPNHYIKYLEYNYGKSWKVPIKDEPANPFFKRYYFRFARWSKDNFIGKILRKIKRVLVG